MQWNVNQYEKFLLYRTKPSIHLANELCEKNPKSVLDIGCGSGNSTEVLKRTFPNARVLGVDNSSSMIEKAKSKNLDVEFLQIELDELFDIKFDIIFSNACLQWIKDHHTLLPRLFNMLNRGGVLSVSFPINHDGYFHHILKSFIKSSKYSDKLANIEPFHTLDTSKYHDILSSLSSDFEIFETIYYHRLNSHEEILQWYKGSGLRAYLQVLNESQSAEFEADLLDVIKKNYSVLSNNEVLLKIPRVFIKIVKV